MRKNEFSKILRCLHCGKPELDAAEAADFLVCRQCNQRYEISNGVVIFIADDGERTSGEAEIHRQYDSSFDYIEHYQTDGKVHDYFEERDAGVEHIDRRVHEYIFSQIKTSTGKVLDTGCGRAWVAGGLCPRGFEVVSMDISHDNTSKALEKYPFENHAAVVADVFSLPFRDEVFDYVIASEIIEHVVDPALFVKNLMRVVKPGGMLIVTTPYKEKIKYTLCVHCNRPTPLHAHLHSFDENKLTGLYREHDLKSCHYIVFANKIPVHFRMQGILQHLNFRWWKIADTFFGLFFKAHLRILVKWQKK